MNNKLSTVTLNTSQVPKIGHVLYANGTTTAIWQNVPRANIFGLGLDGTPATITTTVTLSQDMYYNNLTISSLGTLVTNGFRVFISGILTINIGGSISNNGGSTVNTTAGTGAPSGTLGGGANGGPSNTFGANSTNSLGGSAGSGGIAFVPPTSSGGTKIFNTLSLTGRDLTNTLINGGAGGSGGTLGGGGGGGGVVMVYASTLADTILINARGGNGFSNGAGGGGGVIVLAYQSIETGTSITINVSGGIGATTGSSGRSFIFII